MRSIILAAVFTLMFADFSSPDSGKKDEFPDKTSEFGISNLADVEMHLLRQSSTIDRLERELYQVVDSLNGLIREYKAVIDYRLGELGRESENQAATIREYRNQLEDLQESLRILSQSVRSMESKLPETPSIGDEATSQYIVWLKAIGLILGVLFALILGLVYFRTRKMKKNLAVSSKNMEVFSDFISLFPRKNPFIVGSPIIDREMFFGRKSLITKIINGMHGNHYYIHGERRAGKTSLLKKLANDINHLEDKDFGFIPVPVDFQNISEEEIYKSMSVGLLKAAERATGMNAVGGRSSTVELSLIDTANNVKSAEKLVAFYCEMVDALGFHNDKKTFFIFIIDEFDKINGFDLAIKEGFRWIFMQSEAVTLRLIAAGGQLELWDRTSPFNFMIELDIPKLTTDEARRLVLGPSKGVVSWDDNAVDQILTSCHNEPYLIQKLCSEIVDYALEHKLFKIDGDMVGNFMDSIKIESGSHEPVT